MIMDEQEFQNISDEVDEEVVAVLATYEPEVEEHKKLDDSTEQLYELKVKLGPHSAADDCNFKNMFATVVISIYKGYPSRRAEICFERYGGISLEQQAALQQKVNNVSSDHASNQLGAIFAICTCVQEVLTTYADEQVAKLEAKRIEKEGENKKRLEEEEQKERNFLEKKRNVDLAVREEAKLRREQVRERSISLSDTFDANEKCHPKLQLSLEETAKLKEKTLVPIAFKCKPGVGICDPTLPITVELGSIRVVLDEVRKEKPEAHMHVFFGYDADTKAKLIVYKWAVHINPKKMNTEKVDKFLKSIKLLEAEMNLLLKQRHANLVSCRGMNLLRSGHRCINLFLLYDYVGGLSLDYYLNNKVSLREDMLRHICSGVLSVLDNLHARGIVHRNIRPSIICFDQISQRVKLSDYGLKVKCVEAVAEYYDRHISSIYSPFAGRSKKTADIHRFGLVLVQLFNASRGTPVSVFTKPSGKHTEKFSSFLKCCLENHCSGERWSADELLAHKFITDDDDSSAAYGVDMNGMPWIPDGLKNESRLYKDYTCQYKLGKGGFGSVYKVQSNVEGNFYALKIIKLKEEDFIQSRKMIQEVKLLSSLNHENVVRYYTSWKETLSEMLLVKPIEENMSHKDRTESSLMVKIEDSSSTHIAANVTDDEDSGSILDHAIVYDDDDDSLVAFEDPSNQDQEIVEIVNTSETKRKIKEAELRFSYLYIQMEFCEKNTLRQAIDKWNHSRDESRLWRLFREMANGLNYIHLKGLIHRDLKPGNIFIDSNDHVKIGDFGLATAIAERTTVRSDSPTKSKGKNSAYLTGGVGTTYYIAPEIKNEHSRVKYSNKVDMYSLGIIFFEMVYSFHTGMERAKVLNDLRQETAIYPNDYILRVGATKRQLVEMLLNVDPNKRPNTRNLLDSNLLPPLPAEQQKFINMIKEAIAKEGSARYQEMLQLIFMQDQNPSIEATFEAGHSHQIKHEQLQDFNNIYCSVIDIFKKHGGIWIPTPFFTPKGACYMESGKCADFLTKDGDLITSQFDLRYPFARFLAKSDIKQLKRFYIDKTHKSVTTPSVHPRESYECAFDIVDSHIHLTESMVRLLLITQEVLLEICAFPIDEVIIKLSHTELVFLMLLQANIGLQYHKEVFSLLNDLQRKVYGFDENSFLDCVSKITNGTVNMDILKVILSLNGSVSDVIAAITAKGLCPKTEQHLNAFRNVCEQLEDLVTFSKEMGIKFGFNLQPLMVVDKVLYKGIAVEFQTVKVTRKNPYMVLGKGGSYYHLVSSFKKKTYIKSNTNEKLCSVGISLAMTSLCNAFRKFNCNKCLKKSNNTEVLVCSIEERQITKRMKWVNVLQELGLSVDHCFIEDKNEASPFYNNFKHVENFLCLHPEEDEKYTVKSVEIEDSQTKVSLKYLSPEEVLEYFTKIARPYAASDLNYLANSRKEGIGKNVKLGSHKYELAIEYICRKPLRDKEDKVKQKICEDVDTYITSKFGSYSIPGPVDVIAVDLDKSFVASLRELDLDATLKNFNDSMAELKISCRDSELKENIDKISKFCVKKIFHSKKQDKPFIILAYSIQSEYLRRIY